MMANGPQNWWLLDRPIAFLLKALAHTFLASSWDALRADCDRHLAHHNIANQLFQFNMIATALVAGEDKRFFAHPGIDSKGMLRAIWRLMAYGQLQGGSTITQQLVRTLTGRYEKTLFRKIREMLLATMLDEHLSKESQLVCYLRKAYFGWQMNGIDQALRRLGMTCPVSTQQAALVIARIRHPEPKQASSMLLSRIATRANAIEATMKAEFLP